MKIQDIPKSGKCGNIVAFRSRYGLCLRELVIPRNNVTPARQFMRGAFGHHSQVYSHKLSDEQLDRWHLAGAQGLSDPRLGQSGPMTGQQLYTSINSVRSRVDLPETLEVPARPTFAASPVGSLEISNTEAGVRLRLRISGGLNEDVMVFGQEPCSSGRRKRRHVAYLGLLPPPIDGLSDITDLYKARHGEPRPGTRVFIVTCQQMDGWKGLDREPAIWSRNRQQASRQSPSQPIARFSICTRDAQGIGQPVTSQSPGRIEPETGGGKAAGAVPGGSFGPEGRQSAT